MTTQTNALQLIGLGASANDGTGDVPRVAGQKLNTDLLWLAQRQFIIYTNTTC